MKTASNSLQKSFSEKIKNLSYNKHYHITTYGCQMNAKDSETLAGILEEMGYTPASSQESADLVMFNTCCVRENAENRLYGNLGKAKALKQRNKNLKIALCGCMMQQDIVIDKIKESYNFVDIIFGTYNIHRLPQLIYTNLETGEQVTDLWKEYGEIIEDLPSLRLFLFKASVNIMYGCNNMCSFCIVPYVRGRERSRTPDDILKEIENLVQDGVKEIMLLGQNVNSYGKTLKPRVTFAQLLKEIDKMPLERIRFMTSHPKDLSDELIETMANCRKICNHLHLPLQSGSTEILKKMGRGYTKESYLKLVKKIRAAMPDILLTTDILVGFPTETEEDNDHTIDLIKQAEFSGAYTFIYSKREGTKAAVMEQVSEEIAKERFNKVLETLKPISLKINQSQINTTQKVLAETASKSGTLTGRLDNNLLVHFEGSPDLIGKITDVNITDCKTFYLIGKPVGKTPERTL